MIRTFQRTIRDHEMLPTGCHVVAAVSGGADSVALLLCLHHLASRYRWRISVVHLHHGLRGAEADADAAFVQALAERLGVPCFQARARVAATAKRRGISIEMAAREARYRFFGRVQAAESADVVAVAHTADDQSETVLMRLMRGTGTSGMPGIPYVSMHGACRVARPLLDVRRADLERWLLGRGEAWRADSTNGNVAIPRNFVRHRLLPLAREGLNPGCDVALTRWARIARDEDRLLRDLVPQWLADVATPDGLDADAFAALPVAARRRVMLAWLGEGGVDVRRLAFDDIDRLVHVASGRRGSACVALPGRLCVVREYREVRLEAATRPVAAPYRLGFRWPAEIHMHEIGFCIRAGSGRGIVRDRGGRPGSGVSRACLSRARIGRRKLFIRSCRPGDRMRPFGMRGSRKLQDVLVDLRVPRAQRTRIPVVECGGEIVWLPGYRIASGWEVAEDEPTVELALRWDSDPG